VLEVWLPVPPSDAAQEATTPEYTTFPTDQKPQIAAEPLFGNRFAYFEFRDPHGAQIIRQRYRVKTWELRWNLDAAKVRQVDEWPAAFDPYRRGESQAVQVDDRFRKLLREIVPQSTGPLGDLTAVMHWASDRFEYDHHDARCEPTRPACSTAAAALAATITAAVRRWAGRSAIRPA
jgi:hypothetical protein